MPVMIVTGGSRGIGAAICRMAAERGYDVAFSYNSNAAEAEKVAEDVRAAGQKALVVQANMEHEADIVRLFEETDKELGRVDSMVYNAGIAPNPPGRVDETEWSEIRRVVDVNLIGAHLACREAVKRMSTERGGEGGSIVLIGSRASYYGGAGRATTYAATKAGMETLNYGLGKEVAPEGIRVNLISPGPISTDMGNEKTAPHRIKEIPMGRFGRPEEVASAVMFLASDEASFVSSASLMVSGAR